MEILFSERLLPAGSQSPWRRNEQSSDREVDEENLSRAKDRLEVN